MRTQWLQFGHPLRLHTCWRHWEAPFFVDHTVERPPAFWGAIGGGIGPPSFWGPRDDGQELQERVASLFDLASAAGVLATAGDGFLPLATEWKQPVRLETWGWECTKIQSTQR